MQVQLYQRNDSDSTFAPIQGEGCEWLFHRRKIRGSFPFGKLRVRMTILNIDDNSQHYSHSCIDPIRC